MTVTIIHFNTPVILTLIGMNYLPDLLRSSLCHECQWHKTTKEIVWHTQQHQMAQWRSPPDTTATVTEVIHITLRTLTAKDIITHLSGQLVEKTSLCILAYKLI